MLRELKGDFGMKNMKRSLEGIRDLAMSRVRALNEGESCYSDAEKAAYLKQYESKLRDLEKLIQGLDSESGSGGQEEARHRQRLPLSRFFRRLLE